MQLPSSGCCELLLLEHKQEEAQEDDAATASVGIVEAILLLFVVWFASDGGCDVPDAGVLIDCFEQAETEATKGGNFICVLLLLLLLLTAETEAPPTLFLGKEAAEACASEDVATAASTREVVAETGEA